VHDVIVSGAGPAGCHASYILAKAGLDTVLLERELAPRMKCCGGGLLERAARRLDFPIPDEIIEKEIRGAAVYYLGKRTEINLRNRIAFTVRRDRFDHFLLEMARKVGVQVEEGTVTLGARESSNGVVVKTDRGETEAKALIIAEGFGSITAKALLGPYATHAAAPAMSMNCIFEKTSGNLFEFHMAPSRKAFPGFHPPSYDSGWLFPHRRGVNIGAGGRGMVRGSMEACIANIVASKKEELGELVSNEEILSHPWPLALRRSLHSRKAVAVGDAAGFVNPVTGEGMTYAITSAAYAAVAVRRLLSNQAKQKDPLSAYDLMCRGDLIRDIKSAEWILGLVRGTLGTLDVNKFLEAFAECEALRTACTAIARGEDDWKLLLREALPRVPRLYFSSVVRESRTDPGT
jgi:geranylgeranyl reductase family protein